MAPPKSKTSDKKNALPKRPAKQGRFSSGKKTGGSKPLIPEIIKHESGSRAVTLADPLALYLSELKKYPLLTPEDERKWAIQYFETKDPKAAEILVTSNLRFVVKVAADYARFGARMIDLVQEGNVGLMHAVRDFNPYKGVRLITYAVWWIRGYIHEYMMKQYSLVKLGTTQTQRKLFYQLQNEKQKLEALGKEAGIALLSSRLGVPEADVKDMQQRITRRDVSLDSPLDDETKSTLMDYQTRAETESVDDQIGRREEIHILKDKIEAVRPNLNEKELYILENRILGDPPLTLQEIGEKYGITRERARQLEERVLAKIKQSYNQ